MSRTNAEARYLASLEALSEAVAEELLDRGDWPLIYGENVEEAQREVLEARAALERGGHE